MEKIEIKLRPSALVDFKEVAPKTFDKIIAVFRQCTNGKKVNFKKLQGFPNLYCLCIDNYRVVLEITIHDMNSLCYPYWPSPESPHRFALQYTFYYQGLPHYIDFYSAFLVLIYPLFFH